MERVVSALIRDNGIGGTSPTHGVPWESGGGTCLSLMEYHEYLDSRQRPCGGRFRTRLEFPESLDT